MSGKGKNEVSRADLDQELVGKWLGFYEQALNGELTKMIWKEAANEVKTYEEIRFNLIRDRDKNIIGLSCFSRDVTKHFRHLKMIKNQNRQLKQIAWMHSHEVRGPIATILGLGQLFNLNNPNDEENIEVLNNLIIATNRMDEVIRKINSYTRTSY